MRKGTTVHAQVLDVYTTDLDKKYIIHVTIPGRETKSRTLSEWHDIIEANGDRAEYRGLDEVIVEEINRHELGLTDLGNRFSYRHDQSSKLVSMATQEGNALLFTDTRRKAYIRLKMEKRWRTLDLDDTSFQEWLSSEFFKAEKRAPGSEALRSAIGILKGKAKFEGETHALSLRVAEYGGAFYYDLNDQDGNVVQITPAGWGIIEEPIPMFRRLAHMLPQVLPVKDAGSGHIDAFLDLLNLFGQDRLMFRTMLITDLVPSIPHMCLFVSGPPGSAKSTFARLEKDIIDPSEIDVLSLPKDERELIRALDRSYLCSFDNLSNIIRDRSDMLCQAITGAAVMTRRLFTDDDDYMRKFRTIVRLNGISSEIREPDLLERTILMELREITGTSRKSEKALWRQFRELKPLVLGEMFDILARAMALKGGLTPRYSPRMADYYEWAEVVAVATGSTQDDFYSLFKAYEDKQKCQAIEQSILGPLLTEIGREGFVGTAAQLLETINHRARDIQLDVRRYGWPLNPADLGRKMSPLIKPLKDEGVFVYRGMTYDRLKRSFPEMVDYRVKQNNYGGSERMLVITNRELKSADKASNSTMEDF